MARLPVVKKILREDVKEAPNWIERMLWPINQFFESVFNALDKRLTLVENVRAQIKEITFTTDASYPSVWENIEFPREIPAAPQGLFVMQILQDEDNHTPITTAGHADWLDLNGVITIFHISGLTAGETYTVRFLVV